jgi:hypothetical protein
MNTDAHHFENVGANTNLAFDRIGPRLSMDAGAALGSKLPIRTDL